MWLRVEGGLLVNLTLIEKVEFNESRKTAILWAGGLACIPESAIAYEYFTTKVEVINA